MKEFEEFDKELYTTKYKFNEGQLIMDLREYINSTYSEHYSKNKFQSTEFIIDCGHGEGFALGNVLKYVQRYGKKNGKNRADLLKVLHYAIIALHVHDVEMNHNNASKAESPPAGGGAPPPRQPSQLAPALINNCDTTNALF